MAGGSRWQGQLPSSWAPADTDTPGCLPVRVSWLLSSYQPGARGGALERCRPGGGQLLLLQEAPSPTRWKHTGDSTAAGSGAARAPARPAVRCAGDSQRLNSQETEDLGQSARVFLDKEERDSRGAPH